MGTVTNIVDSLRNAITGAGTKRDARAAYSYGPNYLTQADIERAYRGSGLLRKIIQIPPQDMVREWREWKLDDNEVSLVEALETGLMIKQKVRAVEVLRGLGGGALIMGLPGEPSEPAPAIIGKGQLAFVHVVSRWHLTFQTLETDARQPGYGEPAMWQLSANGSQVDIHPSRVIPFRADTTAALISLSTNQADAFWGESVVAQVLSAVTDSDTARGAFAAMLHKARLTRVGMPDLSGQLAVPGGTERVQARFETLALAESMFNATVFDSGVDGKTGETITDVAYNFAGAKDMMASLNEFVSAISDIPATRLLGRSAEGMNSSGDGQQVDWRKAIKARQELDLGPCVDRLDRYLVPSALGKAVPATGWYEWAALDTPSEKEHADRFKIIVESADKLNNMGVMPDRAFNRGIQSWLINEGMFPELEAALTEIPDDERYGIGQEELEPDLEV